MRISVTKYDYTFVKKKKKSLLLIARDYLTVLRKLKREGTC